MPDLAGVALKLAALVAKGAAKLWLGDQAIAADVSASALDALCRRAGDEIQKEKLRNFFNGLEIKVAERLGPFLERELRGLHEKDAVLRAVAETLEQARLNDLDLFQFDLNPGYVHTHLQRVVPDVPERHLLSEKGTRFYHLVLMECCACLVQVKTSLAGFQTDALVELLRRHREIQDGLGEVLAAMRARHSTDDFEAEYLDQIRTTLDRIDFFGVPTSPRNKDYPLSVAYLSLFMEHGQAAAVRADELLEKSGRLVIRGEAGSGKTTLLRWIAVQCASRQPSTVVRTWTRAVPFFVPLRRFAREGLPRLDQFVDAAGRHMADRMPGGWVDRLLKSGRAIVLIDGVDELPAGQRVDVRAWLQGLVKTYPRSRFIVTSRPAAIEADWLHRLDFADAMLQPMTSKDIRVFIERWYDAMRSNDLPPREREQLELHQERLKVAIDRNRGLRRLAESPLLCALLCALQRDRGELPTSRMSLYNTALDMLLELRDSERDIQPPETFNQDEQRILLQDLAYWMICNGWSDIDRDRALHHIAETLRTLVNVTVSASRALQHLLERTGLLREPTVGRIDFVHRSFQEYLAAKEAVGGGDIGALVRHARDSDWREVIVMAAGHASRPQRDELIGTLIEPLQGDPENSTHRALLAVACLETAPDLEPGLLERVRQRMSELIPPRDFEVARAISSGQELTVDLLRQAPRPTRIDEMTATIRALSLIGTTEALRELQEFVLLTDHRIRGELIRSWQANPTLEYAKQVLSRVRGRRRLEIVHDTEPLVLSLPGEILESLTLLPDVTELTITDGIPDSGPIDLHTLPDDLAVHSLTLETDCTDLEPLTVLANLRSLDLWCASDDVLCRLPDLPRLNALGLGGARLDEAVGRTIAARVGPLTALRLVACTGLPALISSAPHLWSGLRDVVLDRIPPDELVRFSATPPGGLRRLTLASCSSIPVEDIAALQLAELYISSCPKVDLGPFRYTNTTVVVAPSQEVVGAGNVPVRVEERDWPLVRITS